MCSTWNEIRKTFHVERRAATATWDRPAAALRLEQGVASLGLALPSEASPRLLDLCELLALWAGRISLTAHRTPGAILDRLILDALALLTVLPPAMTLADLGAGAGFPGLPLAIARPAVSITLVEARQRKHHFQREAVRRLGLENVRPLLGRAEVLARAGHEGVIAQAMASPVEAIPQCLSWADPGGWIAIPGGGRAPAPGLVPGIESSRVVRYRVPLTQVERSAWIGRRAATGP